MKRILIWAVIMGLCSTLMGGYIGLIPGLIISWIVNKLLDKSENDDNGKKEEDTISCPKCHRINKASSEFCAVCGAPLKENVVDVQANVIDSNESNEKSETEDCGEEPKLTIESGSFEDNTINEYFNEVKPVAVEANEEGNKEESIIEKFDSITETVDEEKNEDLTINISEDIKYCRYCGAQLKAKAIFCHKCGKQI